MQNLLLQRDSFWAPFELCKYSMSVDSKSNPFVTSKFQEKGNSAFLIFLFLILIWAGWCFNKFFTHISFLDWQRMSISKYWDETVTKRNSEILFGRKIFSTSSCIVHHLENLLNSLLRVFFTLIFAQEMEKETFLFCYGGKLAWTDVIVKPLRSILGSKQFNIRAFPLKEGTFNHRIFSLNIKVEETFC